MAGTKYIFHRCVSWLAYLVDICTLFADFLRYGRYDHFSYESEKSCVWTDRVALRCLEKWKMISSWWRSGWSWWKWRWYHYDENYENNDLQNDNLLPDLEHEVRPPPALSRIRSHRRRLLPQVEIDNDKKESWWFWWRAWRERESVWFWLFQL